MTDQQGAGADAAQCRDAPTSGPALRMIAVTAEQLSTASGAAETSDYVPTVPADSLERRLD